jgi:hypothetical protein
MATAPDQLTAFVRECLARGVARADIARELAAAGWADREATLALDAFAESSLPVPVPRKRVSSSARDAFLQIVAMVALLNVAFASGSILFILIERWLPLPIDWHHFDGYWKSGLRWSVAQILVSLPVLWVVQRTIGRDTARNPVSRLTPVYRFLAYLAVLVMALVMLGDLVYVVYNLLQGDATPRFLLKAVVVLTVAGVVSLWYAGDLRREESLAGSAGRPLPPPPAWRDWLGRAGVATAIACIVMALALLESPLRARLLRLDADRVADLQTISRAIENYHERHGELPGSLDDLRADPRTFVRDVDDAVTGTSYGYRATGPRTYELTATFELESPPLDAPNRGDGSQDGFFTHGPGQRTFTVTVPEKRGS